MSGYDLFIKRVYRNVSSYREFVLSWGSFCRFLRNLFRMIK